MGFGLAIIYRLRLVCIGLWSGSIKIIEFVWTSETEAEILKYMMSSVEADSMKALFLLFFAFQIKHFLADYPLQREFMLKKGREGWDFITPLSAHCLVHAIGTAVIVAWVNSSLIWLAGLDFVAHFLMDRFKSGPRYLGRFSDKSSAVYWNCFGFDQLVHHLTHYFIIWVIASSSPQFVSLFQ